MPFRALLTILCLTLALPISAQKESSITIKKVVIDAGHGGRDPGTVSRCGKVREKDITLSVALKLGALITTNHPDIEVIYTRDRDIFIPLDRRSEIANESKADLFISIHVNGARATSANGSETFVMGADASGANLEVTMLENSVVLLEGDNYHERYEGFKPNDPESYIIFSLLQNAHLEQSLTIASLIQNRMGAGPIKRNRGIKQAPFLVLWKTGMPSVLVELGFITNPTDLQILRSQKEHQNFARMIYNAFFEYKSKYEGSYKNRDERQIEPTEKKTAPVTHSPKPHYRVQISSLSRVLPSNHQFYKKRDDIGYIKVGTIYKYTSGSFSTFKEADRHRAKINKEFPGAFVIKVVGEDIVPIN